MSVRISVVIPCFNAARWVAQTLESVASQGRDDLEVIAIDDGSTDNTVEIIRHRFGFVRLLQTPNRGASHARNLGTSIARGAFVQYLDADDLLVPGKLTKQIDALEKTGAEVAYGDWTRLQEDGTGTYQTGETVARRIEGPAEIALFTGFWCPQAAYLFRKEIVERVGGFSERLAVIQDARFVLDCALRGATFIYVPGAAASYRSHRANSLSTRAPLSNLRDLLINAIEIEQWWVGREGMTKPRRAALLKVFGHIARASYELDRNTFDAACNALERISPNYVPDSPKSLAVVSRLTGYRRAESIALHYRRAKRAFTAA